MLLSLETSSPLCSVALHRLADGHLLGHSELRVDKSHSTHLTVLIEQLLANTGHAMPDLTAVAVSDGPGSYTGLRIGAAAAKGLCFALDIPLLAISSLQALAAQVTAVTAAPAGFLFVPMLDARRQEVYTAAYRADGSEVLAPTPLIVTPEAFAGLNPDPANPLQLLCFGSGSAKFAAVAEGRDDVLFLAGIEPSAVAVGTLALAAYRQQQFRDVAYYEPFYLKDVYTTTPRA